MPVAPRWITAVFLLAALVGGAHGLAALVAPGAMAGALALDPIPDPTLVRLWGVLALLLAALCMSILRDPVGGATLAQFVWPAKLGIVLAAALGGAGGDASPRLLAWVAISDGIWVPLMLVADYVLRNPLLPNRR